ncbi:putative ornithine utilization regulator [Thauera linaloolentis 47Lol = DSM 12138]|uniref:Putative ornithine utilization regulator n=2 Tax=Thauera linaloolentis TaxID=76112 RepID=N6Y8N6_THAL4|nr:AraC family transcriptional regulator [Thauera linaloolentis]ENO90686.1 putative ornithine utilization regulator [Thauera linaloolentis 47Lol = DSM 12138]MCM8565594.1 AraC family transcriptional regulator [Thauera linaloolentis]
MGFVNGMLSGMLRHGHDPAPLLAATGISLADAANRIPVDRYATLYNLIIAELDDEAFGLFSRPMPPGSFEFLCRGMLGTTTLEEALSRACRFLRLVLAELRVAVRRRGTHAEIEIAETHASFGGRDDPARVFAFEWLLRLIHSVACWFVNRGIALDAVRFPYARPAHADDYALVYTEHSSFEGSTLLARFHDNLLDLPVRRDDAALGHFLEGAPGRISMLYRRDREMVVRVRDLLRAALPDNLSIEDVARQLHLSTRTLHRRLEDEGSSFRLIKEATRRDIAIALLTKTAQPVGALAADLGYADPSAFYRAFVGWTGISPEQYRSRLAALRQQAGKPA